MVDLSRFRRRRNEPVSRFHDKPSRERHFFSVIGSALSIVLLIVALALREWAKAANDQCKITFGLVRVYIVRSGGGSVSAQDPQATKEYNMSTYYKEDQQILVSCILSVTVLTLLSSIVATVISLGYPREKMEFLRHYSVFNIVSLLCTVLVAGLWLAVVQSLPEGKLGSTDTGCTDMADMTVSFGYCFYFLLVGGLFSLGGASVNLLCARSAADRRRSLRNRFRQRLNREAARRAEAEGTYRDLTQDPSTLPPPYSTVESDLDTGGETTETSMSELETSDQDEPISPPPPYAP